jgi:hypothetical protein
MGVKVSSSANAEHGDLGSRISLFPHGLLARCQRTNPIQE